MPETKNARLEIRLPLSDRDAVLQAAQREGVNKSEWCRRVFALVLGTPQVETGPSEAKDAPTKEQPGPASVPSSSDAEAGHARASANGEGVRPAAQSRTCPHCGHGPDQHSYARAEDFGCRVADCKCSGWLPSARSAVGARGRADAEAKPKRITQPPRRADVGPKPVSATKPRPKATKAKGKR